MHGDITQNDSIMVQLRVHWYQTFPSKKGNTDYPLELNCSHIVWEQPTGFQWFLLWVHGVMGWGGMWVVGRDRWAGVGDKQIDTNPMHLRTPRTYEPHAPNPMHL